MKVKTTGTAAAPSNRKNIIIKNCAPFTDCIDYLDDCERHWHSNANV